MGIKIEVCASSPTSAVTAQRAGAFRVELCQNMAEGGTTPSAGDIIIARDELTSTLLNVIIRPRGGDFCYSPREVSAMLRDIEFARTVGADGVVIGCLTTAGEVDMSVCKELVSAAGTMSVTFHRAFDRVCDPFKALEQIIELGCARILTSGCRPTAADGVDMLARLNTAADSRIIIMPGSGVNASNIQMLIDRVGTTEYHLSGRKPLPERAIFRNPYLNDNIKIIETDYDAIRSVVEIANKN